ncbi:hypothetical protein [Colletotrichum camelliae filamentous virus 1]|uniref:Uncharacterized protein n=1 Tax=Colletotrichum camelliae filamentous virus 1 TaxID=2029458 RepID=A0A286M3N3_9VIRU|nr:hypothetical protein QK579_s5gp2 [Colletotrichum camelliae filamentous virus 1]ASV63097.1 hypothetical protein [Colletotrichum camelliae filamentous virus 1]
MPFFSHRRFLFFFSAVVIGPDRSNPRAPRRGWWNVPRDAV